MMKDDFPQIWVPSWGPCTPKSAPIVSCGSGKKSTTPSALWFYGVEAGEAVDSIEPVGSHQIRGSRYLVRSEMDRVLPLVKRAKIGPVEASGP